MDTNGGTTRHANRHATRIVVFGASGLTGRALLTAAAGAGHPVTAYVRDPGRLAAATPVDRVAVGSVFDPAALENAVAGADAVVIAFGLRGDRRTPLYSRGTELIIDAMRSRGVPRLIVLSEAAYGPHVAGPLPRSIAALYRATARPVIRQRRAQDALVENSGLDWTFIRPSAVAERPARGLRPGLRTPYPWWPSRTTYEDLAALILSALPDVRTHGRSLYP